MELKFFILFIINFLEVSEDVSEQNVSDWVNNERFEGFVHVTKSNFHEIAESGRLFLY